MPNPIYINARTGRRLVDTQLNSLRIGDRLDVVYPAEDVGGMDDKRRTWRKVRFEIIEARDRSGKPYNAFSTIAERTLEPHEIAQYQAVRA